MHYLTVHIEGGLLSPDFLDGLPEAVGQKPADFGLGKRESIVDEVTGTWSDVATYWKAFQSRLARGSGESLTTITREQCARKGEVCACTVAAKRDPRGIDAELLALEAQHS